MQPHRNRRPPCDNSAVASFAGAVAGMSRDERVAKQLPLATQQEQQQQQQNQRAQAPVPQLSTPPFPIDTSYQPGASTQLWLHQPKVNTEAIPTESTPVSHGPMPATMSQRPSFAAGIQEPSLEWPSRAQQNPNPSVPRHAVAPVDWAQRAEAGFGGFDSGAGGAEMRQRPLGEFLPSAEQIALLELLAQQQQPQAQYLPPQQQRQQQQQHHHHHQQQQQQQQHQQQQQQQQQIPPDVILALLQQGFLGPSGSHGVSSQFRPELPASAVPSPGIVGPGGVNAPPLTNVGPGGVNASPFTNVQPGGVNAPPSTNVGPGAAAAAPPSGVAGLGAGAAPSLGRVGLGPQERATSADSSSAPAVRPHANATGALNTAAARETAAGAAAALISPAAAGDRLGSSKGGSGGEGGGGGGGGGGEGGEGAGGRRCVEGSGVWSSVARGAVSGREGKEGPSGREVEAAQLEAKLRARFDANQHPPQDSSQHPPQHTLQHPPQHPPQNAPQAPAVHLAQLEPPHPLRHLPVQPPLEYAGQDAPDQAEVEWRPRTRTRCDASAMERGVIKPRSMKERRRRDKISDGLRQLRQALPAMLLGPRQDMASMIEAAIHHIGNLESRIQEAEMEGDNDGDGDGGERESQKQTLSGREGGGSGELGVKAEEVEGYASEERNHDVEDDLHLDVDFGD
ncbi:hypothetical protein CLOM_g22467 [Closterium sp. NIES-68]|nr:hypothetical protein CLOM_g22467 [Closterium sp. NIES-68]GJP70179.1 hypothetical protein CLOP_g1154 [Closterium sp. NIES-67]